VIVPSADCVKYKEQGFTYEACLREKHRLGEASEARRAFQGKAEEACRRGRQRVGGMRLEGRQHRRGGHQVGSAVAWDSRGPGLRQHTTK
jgi:hypothetical protein